MDEQKKLELMKLLEASKKDPTAMSFMGSESKYRDTGRPMYDPNAQGLKEQILSSLAGNVEGMDSMLGVPYRETANELAKVAKSGGSMGDYASAVGRGLSKAGTDPRAAATGADVVENMMLGDNNVGLKTALATAIDVSDVSGPLGATSKMIKGGEAILPFAATAKKIKPPPVVKEIPGMGKFKEPSLAEILRERQKTGVTGPIIRPERPPIEMKDALADQSVSLKREMPVMSRKDAEAALEYASPSQMSREARALLGLEKMDEGVARMSKADVEYLQKLRSVEAAKKK